MATETMTTLDPKLLGFWTRCIRESSRWSQEALAASSGLDVRTIQRIEAGKPASVTTRRALARGLGYDDFGVFDEPEFIQKVNELLQGTRKVAEESQQKEIEKQFPDHIPVKVSKVTTGQQLGQLADRSDGYLFNVDENISEGAQEQAAAIFDYVRDLGDLGGVVESFSDKLGYHRELGAMVTVLNGLGAAIYTATRSTKLVNDSWVDKTPLPFTIGYLTVVNSQKEIEEMLVPRRASWS